MKAIKVYGCFFLFASCLAAQALEREVWISPIGAAVTNVTNINVSVSVAGTGTIVYPANLTGTETYPFRCPDATSLSNVLHWVLPQTNMTIHFMAGTFETEVGTIVVQIGWKLRGAGIDDTIIQMTPGATVPDGALCVIDWWNGRGVNNADHVEVSDLTVDCNLATLTVIPGGKLGAIQFGGNDIKVSRVKAINWGSATGASNECFVFALSASNTGGPATNSVIEDCIVTQPAAASGAGVTGISAGQGNGNQVANVVRNNVVYGVASGGTNQPGYINAYVAGAMTINNIATGLLGPGSDCVHIDSYSFVDSVVSGNIFDNVTAGMTFNMINSNSSTNLVLKNNVIRLNGGSGIWYLTGSNYWASNLMIMDNIVYPSLTATTCNPLSIGNYMTASVMNNIFQYAGSNADLIMNSNFTQNPQNYYSTSGALQLNTWAGNVNFSGTQLVEANDWDWQPGDQDTIQFTPTSAGWYRIMTGVYYGSIAADITIDSPMWNGYITDTEFWFRMMGGSTSSTIGEVVENRRGSYPFGTAGNVTEVRVGCDGSYTYLDVYVPSTTGALPISVTAKGLLRGRLQVPSGPTTTAPAVSFTQSL